MARDYDRSLEPLYNINSVVAGYTASDQYFDGTNTTLFGFIDKEGSWYIQQQVVTGNNIAWRYARGDGAYSTYWATAISAGLSYDYFDKVF